MQKIYLSSEKFYGLFWLLHVMLWLALGLIFYLIFHTIESSGEYAFVRTLLFAGLGFVFTSVFHLLYRATLNKTGSIIVLGITTVLFCLVFGALWIFLLEFLTWSIYPQLTDWEVLRKFGAKASLNNAFILLSWCASYVGLSHWRVVKDQQQRALAATALAKDAQLQLLRYQLNPHFLFNALNSIRRLIEENPATAKQMVTELSEFLRYSLQDVHAKFIPLTRELECVQNYLAVEKVRFEERLKVTYSVAKEAQQVLVPPFLLMPLVENAVKYGTPPVEIHVDARLNNGDLMLSVRNSGEWVEPPGGNGTGTGLANLRRRLQEMFPEQSHFEISENNGCVNAILRIQRQSYLTEEAR